MAIVWLASGAGPVLFSFLSHRSEFSPFRKKGLHYRPSGVFQEFKKFRPSEKKACIIDHQTFYANLRNFALPKKRRTLSTIRLFPKNGWIFREFKRFRPSRKRPTLSAKIHSMRSFFGISFLHSVYSKNPTNRIFRVHFIQSISIRFIRFCCVKYQVAGLFDNLIRMVPIVPNVLSIPNGSKVKTVLLDNDLALNISIG